MTQARKTGLRAALITGALAGVIGTGTVAANAQGVPADAGQHGTNLQEVAAKLPKVSAQQLLDLARQQVGITENSSGGGTKFQKWYLSSPRASETVARDGGAVGDYANAPWCDMFVSWVGGQLGIGPVLGSDAWTVEHARWFKNHNRWGDVPKPGAVVFFSFKGDKRVDGIEHVGFVVKDNGDGTIQTIEGNAGPGRVEVRTRPGWQVTGYGYPLYTA
ncbi:CHAP domain-containing protein [Microbispora catharanthi]|uniref:CHAP domain-containing protein n=1 Tax=Microbispora catharanthi TaxID=1712871 RepID=A0A5N6BJV5_9ACTN|nr:CHAP domain-containing protein [Microbispora catharanthi]KAB8180856.1 CHAP domain-containing protein [Microbispora catharanthi]